MALKFRRGTTAQQSGSLAFGEPFVNTTLGTLLVGGDTGDITLAVAGTGSTGTFGPISGSGLDITGNANIAGNLTLGGNITIGDAGTDTIAINADLSSSLIPNNDNAFTIGTDSLRYSNIYGVNIIGSISANNGVVSGSSQIVYANISSIPGGIISGSSQLSGTVIPNLSGSFTGSFKGDLAGVAGYASTIATVTTGTTTDTTLYPMFSLNPSPNSYITPTTHPSGSFYYNGVTRKVYGETFVGAIEATNGVVSGSSQVTLQSTTGFSAYDTALATVSGSLISSASADRVSITNLNSYTSSLQAGIQMTGSTVSFLGNIVVYGTQSIINSENLAINDNLIYLNEGSTITNPDLGIAGNYNDGVYAHTGIFRDASDSGAWKVFKGYTPEPSGTIDTAHASFALADFKAAAFTGTSFSGQILSTNGVVSGSSQVIGILSSLNTYTGSNDTTNTTQNTRLTALEASASTALSTNNTQATSITNLNSATASLMIETANLEAFSASALTRLSDLEGKDISITLTGDVTGTGTITNLANVSFATTIAANSVALGTDTTGDYVASLVAGTGVTLSNNSGEGATPTVAIGQSVATNATPTFGNLTINGTITATGDITAYYTSDKRHKNNIQTISNAVLKVKQLNGVTWEWNDDVNEVTKSTPKTGLIAQEVQAVLPQVVTERNDGFLALDYSKMVGLLVEAIKEQQIQIDQLKAQIGSK